MEIIEKKPKLCCPTDQSVFVGGDLYSINKYKLKELLSLIIENKSVHVLKKPEKNYGHVHFTSKEDAEDFYKNVHDNAFILNDKEFGKVEIYFLQSREYENRKENSHKRKHSDQERHDFDAIITKKDIEIKNLKKDIEKKERHDFNDNQLKNFEAIIAEKDIEIKNLKKDVEEKERQIRDLKKNAEKAEENNQFHELFNIMFDDNANNDLDLESKIKKLKREVCLIYFEKAKEKFVMSVFDMKENLGSDLKKFLDHLLEQSEVIEKNIDKNQESVTFAKGQLNAFKIVLEGKLQHGELETLLNEQKKILRLESQLCFL